MASILTEGCRQRRGQIEMADENSDVVRAFVVGFLVDAVLLAFAVWIGWGRGGFWGAFALVVLVVAHLALSVWVTVSSGGDLEERDLKFVRWGPLYAIWYVVFS